MKKNTKQTSSKEASEAGHLLSTSKSKIVKRVAASALSQAAPKKATKKR